MSDERVLLKSLRMAFEGAYGDGCFKRQEGGASDNCSSNSTLTDAEGCYSQPPGVDHDEHGEPIDGGPVMGRDDDEKGKLARRIRFQGEEGYFVRSLPQTDERAYGLVREIVREVTVMQLQAFGQIHQLQREDMMRMDEAHREERRLERERNDAIAMAYQKALAKMADTTADIATLLKTQREAPTRAPLLDWSKVLDIGERLAAKVANDQFGKTND
jgi:hypothetical protein